MEGGRQAADSLTTQKQRLKNEYTDLAQKFEAAKRNSLTRLQNEEFRQKVINSASRRLQIYKHEHQQMKDRLSALDTYSTRVELEQLVKGQEQELKQLTHLNQRLNKSPSAQPPPQKKNFTGEEIKELNYFKREVASLQAALEKSQHQLSSLQQESQQLAAQHAQVKSQVHSSEPDNSQLYQRHQWLEKKLEVLKAAKQSRSERHRLQVKELEQELKALDETGLRLQLEQMKKGQQARLFAVEQQRLNTARFAAGNMDDWAPSVDFIYKPSVSKIYYT